MVFDWFKRNLQPRSADTNPAADVANADPVLAPSAPEVGAESTRSSDLEPEVPEADSMPPTEQSPLPAPPQAVETAPASDPDDALAWARQAYARLKAQQQAQTAEPVAEAPAPVPVPPAPASGSPSLLEQAAARRAERQQALTAPPLTNGDSARAASSAPVVTADPVGEGPQLGAFDDSFTWSADVLAAQGRRPDEISLEEIDWLGRLRQGLEKTRRGFVTQLLDNLGDDPLTPEVLDDLETTLLRADAPIESSGVPLLAPQKGRLNVWLMVGVNGVGKTTTLGKLANLAVRSGYSCLIAAADTFRAAAVQQVQVWGERSGVPVIANPSANADPAAVVYDAIGAAQAHGTELVLVDTAGRLQTKHNLMEELAKVRRIVDKLAPEAAVESLLVLDASQGQNGLRQAMAFASAAGLTGVVVTKLDGSARGGVALAVASEAGLPIRFIGAGEGIRDLRPFNSFEFVEALLAS
jgi:fused signal recognition particle receptor